MFFFRCIDNIDTSVSTPSNPHRETREWFVAGIPHPFRGPEDREYKPDALNRVHWGFKTLMIGKKFGFKILSMTANSISFPRCDDLAMNLEMKRLKTTGDVSDTMSEQGGLEKTLLSKWIIEGGWAITVQDEEWDFTVIKADFMVARSKRLASGRAGGE